MNHPLLSPNGIILFMAMVTAWEKVALRPTKTKIRRQSHSTKQNSYAAVQTYNIEYRNTSMEHKSKLVNKKETIHCPIGAFEILHLLVPMHN